MRKAIFTVLAVSVFVVAGKVLGSAADERAKRDVNYIPTMVALDEATGEIRNIKVSGDGYMVITTTAPYPGMSYGYEEEQFTVAPGSLTLSGIGWSYFYKVEGGSATFNVDGGDSVTISDTESIAAEFRFTAQNPSIFLTHLQAGATARILIDGVK